MPYLIYRPGNDTAKILRDHELSEVALAIHRGAKVYRAQADGSGGFDLIPQRIQPGSEVYDQIFRSGTVEDAP